MPINNQLFPSNNISTINSLNFSDNIVKRNSEFIYTISKAINKAGGLTSYSDIKRIVLIRDVPIGKGGGKKKTIVDLSSFLNNTSTKMDLRLFDGDAIYIPKSNVMNQEVLKKSILAGITPKFINITIRGKIENQGQVKIPVEGTLSDAISLTGPRKPLSGKIFLLRYDKDGSLIRKNIRFSRNASAGTKGNPYLPDGDIVSIRNSLFGRSTGLIKEVTQPMIGIYTTKEIIESF